MWSWLKKSQVEETRVRSLFAKLDWASNVIQALISSWEKVGCGWEKCNRCWASIDFEKLSDDWASICVEKPSDG